MNGFVYFIKPVGHIGPIKIGFSKKPEARLEGLMGWSPLKLEIIHTIPGDMKLEIKIHSHFADLHSHHEWFNPERRLIDAIEAMKGGKTIFEAVDLGDRRGRVNGRPDWTDAQRSRLSYVSRIRSALINIRQENCHLRFWLPDDVQEIVDKWRGQTGLACRFLAPAEYQRLDEFLHDPKAHILTSERAAA